MEDLCRSCLDPVGETPKCWLFADQYSPPLWIQFSSVAQVSITKDDSLPQFICTNCLELITLALNFQEKAQESDLALRARLIKKEEPDAYDAIEFLDLDGNMRDADSESDEAKDDSSEKFNCGKCKKVFACSQALKYHERLHTGESLRHCPECDKGFIKQSHVHRHMRQVHKMSPPAPVEDSEKPSKRKKSKVASESEETSEESDDQSAKEEPTERLQCSKCDKSFGCLKTLKYHERLHTGESLRHCPECKKGFIKQSHVDRHLKQVHNITRESPSRKKDSSSSQITKTLICKICDASQSSIFDLRAHLHSHMDMHSLMNVDWLTKLSLFDEADLVEGCDNDLLISLVMRKLEAGKNSQFYYILTPDCLERSLSDTDSDEEETKSGSYKCSKCFEVLRTSRQVENHVTEKHPMATFDDKCEVCSRQFACQELLDKHLRQQCNNSSKTYFCSLCNLKFQWEESFNLHMDRVHADSTHQRKFFCSVCRKSFIRSEHLQRHQRTHDQASKIFECQICKRKFNRKDNLKSHMKIHEPDRDKKEQPSYLCVYCGRSFTSSSNLIVHTRRHTGEKPHKCGTCGKGFPRKSDLKCHERTHTGEREAVCGVCGKAFSRSNKLVRHMRIHLGIRPYSCPHCSRTFTQSNDLTLHIRRHTGEKPYGCSCGERFIQGTALRAHTRATGHTEDPSNPNSYKVVSVNNPNRNIGLKIKMDKDVSIRPVAKKGKAVKTQQEEVEPQMEGAAKVDGIKMETPSANYGVTLLSNGNVVMSNLEIPSMFQVAP